MINREKWNSLYQNLNEERSKLEIQSVPDEESWGKTTEDKILENSMRVNDKSILDLGTGIGAHLATVLFKFPDVIGVGMDISDTAVHIGNQLILNHNLQDRMYLFQAGFTDNWSSLLKQKFDIVSAICSMQFCRKKDLPKLLEQVKEVLKPDGRFVCKCRSTRRDIPDSYILTDEENTYISHENHEYGMTYHHYTKSDMEYIADLLGGKIIVLQEEIKYREYDKKPKRAWWELIVDLL